METLTLNLTRCSSSSWIRIRWARNLVKHRYHKFARKCWKLHLPGEKPLIKDNSALGIFHNPLTYPPTTDQSTRAVERVVVRHQGRSNIDTFIPELYESSDIPGALQDPTANSTPMDLRRVVKFCLQISHLEMCSITSQPTCRHIIMWK